MTEPMDNPADTTILIVDDMPDNLQILQDRLESVGYSTAIVTNGKACLEVAQGTHPDLILLDIQMPEMDGFETCRRLKQDPATQAIPVIFVTARQDTEAVVQGFRAGGVDYITKPYQGAEVLARVETHLRIDRLTRQLAESNEHANALNEELQLRYGELQKLEVMRESLTQMIVHDLRNPLGSVLGYVELLEMGGHVPREPTPQDYQRAIRLGGQTLMDMINAMLDLAKLEAGEMVLKIEEIALTEVLDDVKVGLAAQLDRRKLSLQIHISEGLSPVSADRESLRRILVNIIGNAISFSPPSGEITVAASEEEGQIRLAIRDQGPGILEEEKARIFDKFGQIESKQSGRKYSTGLGLAFCKMAVEAHGGQIGVESQIGEGSTFWFTLAAAHETGRRE